MTFKKNERLCGKTNIDNLLKKGNWGCQGCIKFCCLIQEEGTEHRVMVSAPKRFFKRAVKRNLLKRRIRESYRTQKDILDTCLPLDILFYYNSKEVLDFNTIKDDMSATLSLLAQKCRRD